MSRQIKNTENTLHQTFKQAGFHQIDDDYSALCQDSYNSSHQAVESEISAASDEGGEDGDESNL